MVTHAKAPSPNPTKRPIISTPYLRTARRHHDSILQRAMNRKKPAELRVHRIRLGQGVQPHGIDAAAHDIAPKRVEGIRERLRTFFAPVAARHERAADAWQYQ